MLAACLAATLIVQEPKVDPRRPTLTGAIEKIAAFESKILNNKRNLWVYTPPGYEEAERRRYPVLYCHDGQNVFDGATSFIPGMEWRVDEATNALILANLIEPIIVVAVENAGVARADEYLPTRFKFRDSEMGGKAPLYGRFLVEEVKPFVDRKYRTRTGGRDTAMMGSSFGGVVTQHVGLQYPSTFGKLAVMSPSVWVNDHEMVRRVQSLSKKAPVKVWLDMGGDEAPQAMSDVNRLFDAYLGKGWVAGKDVVLYQDGFAKHNEEAWSRRVPAVLMWFFGKK